MSLCACAPENTGRPGTGEPGMPRACESGSRGVWGRESARQAQQGCRGQSGNAGKGRTGQEILLHMCWPWGLCRACAGGFAQWPLAYPAYPACPASCAMPVACLSGNQALCTVLMVHCLSRAQISAACRCWQRDSCAAPCLFCRPDLPGSPCSLLGAWEHVLQNTAGACAAACSLCTGDGGCKLVILLP